MLVVPKKPKKQAVPPNPVPTLAAQKTHAEDGHPDYYLFNRISGYYPDYVSSLVQQPPVAEFAEDLFDGPVEVVGAFDDEVRVGLRG